MKKSLFVLSLTILFLLGATSCSSTAASTPGITNQGKNVTIVLEENPTTGYTWAYTVDNQNVLELANDQYTQNQTDKNVVGAGGLHAYVFTAKSAGTATITFELGQQWEGGEKGAKVQKFQVTVGQDGNVSSAQEIK